MKLDKKTTAAYSYRTKALRDQRNKTKNKKKKKLTWRGEERGAGSGVFY